MHLLMLVASEVKINQKDNTVVLPNFFSHVYHVNVAQIFFRLNYVSSNLLNSVFCAIESQEPKMSLTSFRTEDSETMQ